VALLDGQEIGSTRRRTTGVSQPTETEQAFSLGIEGEDTAIPAEEYFAAKDEEFDAEAQTESMLQEYLEGEGADDGYKYEEEYLRSLKPNRLIDILYEEDRDLVTKYQDPTSQQAEDNEFVVSSVPRAIAPYVRVVAKGAGYAVIKPLKEVEPVIAEGVQKALRERQTEEVSEGAEISARELTTRERHEAGIANLLEKTGVASSTYSARQMARSFVGDANADSVLGSIGAADISPLGAYYAIDEAADDIAAANRRNADAIDYVAPGIVMGLSALEAFPLTKGLAKAGKRVVRGKGIGALNETKTIDDIRFDVDSREAAYASEQATKKYNIDRTIKVTEEVQVAQKKAAREVASKNQDIMDELITAYEKTHFAGEPAISKVVKGKKVIDYEKVRSVGVSRMTDLDLPEGEVSTLGFGADGYRMPFLAPDKLDPLIATIADLKAANPNLFEVVDEGTNGFERLFRASVEGDLLASPELAEALSKYGLSMDDFVLQVAGSGHEAGKALQKHKQIVEAMRAKKTPEQIAEEKLNETMKGMSTGGKIVRRVENIIRGSMVSTIATAARNFEGFLVRAPMEGLTNLFTNAIHASATGEFLPFIKSNPFKNSMQTYGEMFKDRQGIQEYTDFILNRPEYAKMYERFYNQVNEVQTGLGRGEAREKQIEAFMKAEKESAKKSKKKFDKVQARENAEKLADETMSAGKMTDYTLTKMEDFVHFLNGPNRMQEFLVRRTAFMDKLGQLTKREYGLDLVDTINSGKMGDLLNDNARLVGDNKRSFKELVADATESSLDVTYANAPKFGAFKWALEGLNATPGSTLALPFPRFMFKAAEYMYETTLGLPTAMTRRIFGLGEAGGKFVTAQGKATYNTEMAARGMAGWSAIGATYMAAEAGLITDDNKVRIPGTNKKIDVTPQFPLAQLVYLGNGMKKMMSSEKDFFEWFDGREFVKLFSGTNFRTNTGLGEFIDDMFEMASNESKIEKKEKLAEAIGKFFADITTRVAQPYQQVIDLERGLGFRDKTIRSYESDPTMTMFGVGEEGLGSFGRGFQEKLQTRGYTTQEGGLTAKIGEAMGMGMTEDDRYAPVKEYATKPGGKEREFPLIKFALGLNIMEQGTEEQQFFKKYGFNDWDFSSKTGVGTVDNTMNETLSGLLPSLAQSMMNLELRYESKGKSDTFIKQEIAARIKQASNNIKSKIIKQGIKSRGADDPAYVQELFKLRTYSAEAQRIIVTRFTEANDGIPPDLSNTSDLRDLNKIGTRGRYKKNLFE